MLSSGRVSLVALCCLMSLVLVSGTNTWSWTPTPPNTPANQADVTNPNVAMCLMSKLEANGLQLVQTGRTDGQVRSGFEQNHFTYTCSCNADFRGTVIHPTLVDDASSAEITFNGVVIHSRLKQNAISNFGTALTQMQRWSPRTTAQGSDFLNFQSGKNTIIIGVGCNGRADPDCYYQYKIECTKPGSGSSVTGDPQFVGLRGQHYQVHGVAGEVYNIVSDADLQYNSRFVFLTQGECPRVGGIKQKGCYSHPGSYLGELGLKTRAGDKIQLVSGSAAQGFASVQVNGQELGMDETVMLAESLGSVSRNSTHMASVHVGNWDFVFENSDMFINQKVRVLDARSLRSHGLLGQTWREVTYPNAVKHIQGDVDDYVIRSNDVFGDDFVYNAHN